MKKINNLEKSLMIKEPENIFSRFFNWMKNLFGKKEEVIYNSDLVENEPNIMPEFTIPKAVQIPVRQEVEEELVENSLEYLYKLSDAELDSLNQDYDNQMEEAKNELMKLENILQTYKQSIKKLQGQVESEEL